MFIVLGFLINALIIGILVSSIGKTEVINEVMQPIAIAIFCMMTSLPIVFLLDGLIGTVVSSAVYLITLYYLIGFFYGLDTKIKRKIVGVFLVINVILKVLFSVAQ